MEDGRVIHYGNVPVAFLNPNSREISYNKTAISEIVAGSISGKFTITSTRPNYRFDKNRKRNNALIYELFRSNPLVQNRVRIVNSLVFGRGFQYSYDDKTQMIIDRFWSINKLKQKLNSMGTDGQLYGEVFIGLFPQDTGDVLTGIYEPTNVDIDFNPENVQDINEYHVSYRDEQSNKDMTFKLYPLEKFIRDVEFSAPLTTTVSRKIRKLLSGNPLPAGYKGAMLHIKFNITSSEIHGTSDFRQSYGPVNDYMDFLSDRMNIHQIYGSPMVDIEIDTDDEEKITERIEELANFEFGSNPVHNKQEKWTPLSFDIPSNPAEVDAESMKGLISAGMGVPEHLLFNQIEDQTEDGTFVLNKMAEDIQDNFGQGIHDMHKFVAYMGNQDVEAVNTGQVIFPEISTMSEKTKAETYVLKVGAGICSRKTASLNTGHNWNIELQQIEEERAFFEPLTQDSDMAGVMGGRFSNRLNNQDPNRDDGSNDRQKRLEAQNIQDQRFGNRKQNN